MLKHDIELPTSVPELLLEKHANFLLSYGTDKDEYVSIIFILKVFFKEYSMVITVFILNIVIIDC